MADQKAIIYAEVVRILDEQRGLAEHQVRLQSRLEELLLTLKVKGEFEQSTPKRALVNRTTGSAVDEDDLGPAPIDYSEDANTLETESGWDRVTPQSRGKSFGASVLSLSYSFSPVTTNNNTRTDISEGGLSPAPLMSEKKSPVPALSDTSGLSPAPLSARKSPVPHDVGGVSPAPLLSSKKVRGANEMATADDEGQNMGASSVNLIVDAAAAAVGRLFGSSPTRSGLKEVVVVLEKKAPEEVVVTSETTEDRRDSEEAESEHGEEENGGDVDDLDDEDEEHGPSDSDATPLSQAEKAEREAQAASMTMAALSQNLNLWLAKSGAGNTSRGLKDCVDECCKRLGVVCSGNLRKDAGACYVLTGAQVRKMPSPSKTVGSPEKAPLQRQSQSQAPPESPAVVATHSRTAEAPVPSTPDVLPINPSALNIFSPTSTSSFASRLRNFYRVHNPEKDSSDIEQIVRQFAGKEHELIAKLEKKYAAKFPLV